ncbi:glycosyltransferase family 2 protein [Pantoea ananatis]
MITVASLVLYKHAYNDVKKTIDCLLLEKKISKVVIVDNGSHCAWLSSLKSTKLNLVALESNDGFGAGHNATIERFGDEADFILICNPDISFEQGEVDKLIDFSSQSNIALSAPKILYPDGNIQHSCKLLPTPTQLFARRFLARFCFKQNSVYELVEADYSKSFFAPSMSGCFMLLSRKAIAVTKGFDTQYFMYLEDVDFSRRVSSAGLNVRYCPNSYVIHESQRRSYTSYKFLIYHIKSAVRYFNKWGWFIDKERDILNRKCLIELPRV